MKVTEEVAVMKNDIAHIKGNISQMSGKIDKMYDILIDGDGKIHLLNKEVFGNGQLGLRAEINDLKKYLFIGIGGLAVITFVLNIWLS